MNPYSHLLVSLAVIVIAGLVIFGKKIWEAVAAPFRRFSRWMHELTADYSGEDSDQQVATIGAAMLNDELAAGRRTDRTRSYLRKNGWWLAEFKAHSGGIKRGVVMATRRRGLHGQAKINVGPGKYTAWRSLAKLAKVM